MAVSLVVEASVQLMLMTKICLSLEQPELCLAVEDGVCWTFCGSLVGLELLQASPNAGLGHCAG